jgi:predicted  nucleic acid-binding Zn-ribbon protein
LKEQLKLLENLQQVDARLHETQEALTSLPAKLQSLKDDVKRVATLLESERGRLAEVQAYKAEIERTMKADQEQLSKAKSKLAQVRTSKEYMATQREVEATRKSTGEREEELLKLMEAIESFQQSIKVHEEELQALEAHVAEEETETVQKVHELEQRLAAEEAERDEMAATIRKDVLRKYNAIRRRRDSAVVPARHGVCMGCNMALPPQLFNILQRGTTIEYCPSCQRIVYYEPEENNASG